MHSSFDQFRILYSRIFKTNTYTKYTLVIKKFIINYLQAKSPFPDALIEDLSVLNEVSFKIFTF